MPTLSSAPETVFATIANALQAAAEGDTLLLEAGTYDEALSLTVDSFTMRAANKKDKVIIRSYSGPVVECCGINIVIEGVELQQTCCDSPTDCVVIKQGSVSLENVAMTSTMGTGLVVSGDHVRVSISEGSFVGTGKYGCLVTDGASVEAKNSRIERCKAAGIVSRGRGSKFAAQQCIVRENGKVHM